ncbi:hypothetical protein BSK59_13415 [Paenibacillus odorifer]|uniref:accessory gene regulator B family protein n=1 Tax=Paenibacillus odorifer TaxID=189426 RepID=UPI00096ECCC0|nr:accessory gene regulator B family protein [Paenibacillus odorifer]OME55471.1 hypothetical protein BSK59_13415 [Paenibacillus odorifer]
MKKVIEKIAQYIVTWIVKNVDEKERDIETKVLERRLSVVLIYVFLLLTLITVGLYFDNLIDLLIITLGLAFIRTVSGGNHFNSASVCYIVTTSAILSVPIIREFIPMKYEFHLFITSIIVYGIFSPTNEISKKGKILKKTLLLLVLTMAYVYRIHDIQFIYFILIPDQIINNHFDSHKERQ